MHTAIFSNGARKAIKYLGVANNCLIVMENELTPHILLTWMFVPLYCYSLFLCVQTYGSLTSWEKFGLNLSLGGANNVIMVITHELGHKRNKICQVLGLIGAAILVNPDFVYDHASFHHAHAATPKDTQTAPFGMSYYFYTLRIFRNVYPRAGEKLLNRLYSRKVDKLVIWFVIVIFECLLCFQLGGRDGLFFFLSHSLIGFAFLTGVSYIQHYGMLRKKLSNGDYEPIDFFNTAWDSDFWLSNVIFWNANHHAEHHVYPRKLYNQYSFIDTPKLPMGSVSMIFMAFCPPLWFCCMNKRVLAHQELLEKKTKDLMPSNNQQTYM